MNKDVKIASVRRLSGLSLSLVLIDVSLLTINLLLEVTLCSRERIGLWLKSKVNTTTSCWNLFLKQLRLIVNIIARVRSKFDHYFRSRPVAAPRTVVTAHSLYTMTAMYMLSRYC